MTSDEGSDQFDFSGVEPRGKDLVENASEYISPDTVALYALSGMLASGFDHAVAASHVWNIIVPDFMSSRDRYWAMVGNTGSLNPMLSGLNPETGQQWEVKPSSEPSAAGSSLSDPADEE